MAQEGSSPVSYLENTFILILLLQWMSCCKGAGGWQRPAKQLKQANSRTCASCRWAAITGTVAAVAPALPTHFWLASTPDVAGCIVNGEVEKGLKCRVINLSTCTHSTSRSTTADSLLSATCTNHAPMRETRNKHKDRIFLGAVTAAERLRPSD